MFRIEPFGAPPQASVALLRTALLNGGFLGKPPAQPEQLLLALTVGEVMGWELEAVGSGWRARILRPDERIPRPDVRRVRVFVRKADGFYELF